MDEKSKIRLRKQKSLFYTASFILVCLALVVSYFVLDEGPSSYRDVETQRKVDLPSDKVEFQDAWMSRLETSEKNLELRLKNMETILLASKQVEAQKEREILEQKAEIRDLQRDLEEIRSKASIPPVVVDTPSKTTTVEDPFSVNEKVKKENRGLEFVSLPKGSAISKIRNVDFSIPAGTTVRAILVSSTDAPTGVYASNNPQPVKLRVLDNSHLPNDVRVRLKGAILIASAFGDLSSERVFVRLEKMTQTKPNGNFIETDVAGYISGEDGKYGIRGTVVDRSDKLLKNVAFSGFFAGVSQYFTTTENAQNVASTWTNEFSPSFRLDFLQAGLAQGSTASLSKLSEYYLKKAEQLSPVIEVSAGRYVDITFTQGTDLGELHTKERIKKIREEHNG
jgi:conjugal transfer pilus assembly protein TraB